MEIIIEPIREAWSKILKRPEIEKLELEEKVRSIFQLVGEEGDQGLLELTRKFDGVDLSGLQVADDMITQAGALLSEELKNAIQVAYRNISLFHEAQKSSEQRIETSKGTVCWQEFRALERVGIYIPGGEAPLFSTVLMLGIPAKIAGCKEIVVCTPPSANGSVDPAILYCAQLIGATSIYAVGGAQAIAAMTLGTESMVKVDKIFGPGNQFVTEAKRFSQYLGTAIDMLAGPSEVCVYADESCSPTFVAADLLSQAEHGEDSHVLAIVPSIELARKVKSEVNLQLQDLPRQEVAQKSLASGSIVVLSDQELAIELINQYAPEHLILATANSYEMSAKIINAGSIFLGNFTPESAGDYASGTNHTLPTGGQAKITGGVNLMSFGKMVTFQEISEIGLKELSSTIRTMAEAEGLHAHAYAVKIRESKIKQLI